MINLINNSVTSDISPPKIVQYQCSVLLLLLCDPAVTSYQDNATPRRLPAAAGRGGAEAGRVEGGGGPQCVQQPRPQLL